MHVNCIMCGHRFDLGKSYDDYEGAVRCSTCRGLLEVRTRDGQVKMVRPFGPPGGNGYLTPQTQAELAAEKAHAAAPASVVAQPGAGNATAA